MDGYSLSPLLFNLALEVLSKATRQEKKKKKRQPECKVRSKTVLVTDDRILYIENPKKSIKVLLKLREKFNKLARCDINIQKLIAFLNTCNKQS